MFSSLYRQKELSIEEARDKKRHLKPLAYKTAFIVLYILLAL